MTTTTDLSAERAILHWAADRIETDYGDEEGDGIAEMVRVWADDLDATPTTYALPAEPPPEVTEVWDRHGRRWERHEALGHVRWRRIFGDGSLIIRTWPELLAAGPLSTVPPAGTEGDRGQ